MIVSLANIQKYYGANLVLSDISFEIKAGDRVGLIGRNGQGKTTIAKILTGHFKPDGGSLTLRKGTKIGCLEQIPDYQDETSVYDVLARGYSDVRDAQTRMGVLEAQMTLPEVYESESRLQKVLGDYDRLRTAFEQGGGYEMEAHIERVARGLGIPEAQFQRPFRSLSGGEKTKAGIAALLVERPDLLLLDEPTNHLDMHAIEWLEQYLMTYDGTVVVISHDRYFLDKVVTKVIEIEDGEAFTYHANYSGYQQQKEENLLNQFNAFQEQQKKIKKIQEAIKRLREWAKLNPQNTSFHKKANSMQKMLDRMEKLKRPILERKAIDLHLTQSDRSGKQVAVLEEISKSFGPRQLFQGVSEMLVYGERVFLIGENGAGKSTIFKMLLGDLEPDAGSVKLGARVEVGYLAQEAAPKDESKTVLQYFRDEVAVPMEEGQARGQLSRFLFYGADVFKAVKSLSGGEWTRLRLALLTYLKPNLLLLDEPTNHLDIDSREALEDALDEFPGTLLVISHDRYLINRLSHRIWALEQGQLTNYLGNFEFYKEKRPDRVAFVEKAPLPPAFVPAASPAPRPVPPAAKKKINPYAQAKLEAEIAEAEAQLALLDTGLADPSNAKDATQLQTLYSDRESTQQRLDQLLEQWMEMEG
ncbi:ribosomal protection-like ABC-F family protein [Tumebacillus permanentifrigoris]|uniref:ATPase subunit of ABC transporter with duplicated ATPase domains n=1 Tax=Tumebacillus permanentifrigoris TaxID=378543 RepID=A0A316D9H9_9BACL|nr:ABC-F family ATP-binding cassette domain-containing protein [Tumebacillus permanentifrigoris]PWK11592.1 ATPase subunit of ABC transporter with duplicated ATPase domains [Tumebacillus permanentifrigoris]